MNNHPLLASAPAGRHFCQLHKTPQTLAESVAQFISSGLKHVERVVIIAAPAHVELIVADLTQQEWDCDAFSASGQLVIIDAHQTLDEFMRDGMPDWKLFRKTIRGILDCAPPTGIGRTRAYGEMVNILWHQGNSAAAIKLEEYWNELAKECDFSLFCCYLLDGLDDRSYAGPLHDIGRTHSDVLLTRDDVRFQDAVDQASREVLGGTLSMTLSLSGREEVVGEHKLPTGQRTLLWLKRNMPAIHSRVLDRARHHYGAATA